MTGEERTGLPPKPEGSYWSDDQWRAISESGDDILVAAAAGSGKTAVLVERIIRRISDPEAGFSVDRLLVATFTKAAASEMRQRIREALERELDAAPENEHLRRQLALLGRASITTLHSFCLEVIRRYYQMIPLDPGFRILSEHEAELMRQELLEELFEDKYGESGEDGLFVRMADWFSGERSDDAVLALVQRLRDFARSHPWPDEWLRETAAAFEAESEEKLGETLWVRSLLDEAALTLEGAESRLRRGLELCREPEGPAPYAENLEADLDIVCGLLDAVRSGRWEELHGRFRSAAFGKLKPCRKDAADPVLQEKVKTLRDEAKKALADLQGSLFGRPPGDFLREMREAAPIMRELAETVIEFESRFRAAKAARGLVDFSDLEHYCLKILRHPDSRPGDPQPSDAALEYRQRFDEVLLDEYQDTNSVQEEIVRLIARETPGNRFMVGDMKQSIYRFRLAEPGLFLDKYRSYSSGVRTEADAEGGAGGIVIDLSRNFRSRPEVVNAANGIFRRIMREKVAEIDYDDRAELVYGASFPGADARTAETAFAPELLLIDRGSSARSVPAAEEEGAENAESELAESETAQLEARAIARRIAGIVGASGAAPMQIYDKAMKGMRPAVYGDIVILLRSASVWAPLMMEELRQAGIPAYGDSSAGYFQATEVEVMLSLLKTIDNPQQDIPLAGTLRSPIVGLTEEELALVRLQARGSFYEAMLAAAGTDGAWSPGAGLAAVPAGDAQRVSGPYAAPLSESAAETAASSEVGSGTAAKPSLQEENPAFSSPAEEEPPAPVPDELRRKLLWFLDRLASWRDEARQGSLSGLIWRVYGESGYLEWVGGLPGGVQRQSNLKTLYDRAVQFERDTASRGLFRFLVFIERLRDNGRDLGAAGGSAEEGEGVRIMTIHKSKGLEFPVVFLAGMSKMFNRQDLHASFLMHKELGFGPRFMERETRVAYPTLPYLAISRRSRMELLAEEMRVLYVGLTRPRDKMILVGTLRDLASSAGNWLAAAGGGSVADHVLARARSYMDWLGPALITHPGAAILRKIAGGEAVALTDDGAGWSVGVLPAAELAVGFAPPARGEDAAEREAVLEALSQGRPIPAYGSGSAEAASRLGWVYPYKEASALPAKTSVTELKSLLTLQNEPSYDLLGEDGVTEGDGSGFTPPGAGAGAEEPARAGTSTPDQLHLRRPKFMEARGISPAERGTAYHTVMQHMPLDGPADSAAVEAVLEYLQESGILTKEQRSSVEPGDIAGFCGSPIGERLRAAEWKRRELPFSYTVPASEAYRNAGALGRAAEELERSGAKVRGRVLIQGVIDCLFRENGRLILLDYKTDAVLPHKGGIDALREKYRVQLTLYAKALGDILGEEIAESWLYFFDNGEAVRL
ncbi:helicase-exonuclease AddAB subunit AddA [Paenibacillus glufosinatiresistens]|uniref:helicase-exonuclease AddAB subunit AddA n=1 Tax=Paenibacillus glufosinatiresistens TaxID=3070657 RepID=UPI00286DDA54|nr:helicase-exonuclease AddAB subunit AddA [Paenibacillus sp. YX.27]